MRLTQESPVLPPSAGGSATRLAVARLDAAGVDVEPLLRRAGLKPSQVYDPAIRIAVRNQIKFLDLAAEALDDELLGFHMGESLDLRALGLLYYVMASSATLGEGLERVSRYSIISNEGVALRIVRGSDLRIRLTYLGVPRHTDRQQIELFVTILARGCCELAGTRITPLSVRLSHTRGETSHQFESFLSRTIEFSASEDEIVFPGVVRSLPLVSADPYLHDLLCKMGDEALADRSDVASPLRSRVENAVTPLLPHGTARVVEVANALGMSQRTLARRLAAESLTFAGVVEDLKADLARRYLKDATLSISRIAWLLGYQEPSAFTHAFKRWTGSTPTQQRRTSQDRGARNVVRAADPRRASHAVRRAR